MSGSWPAFEQGTGYKLDTIYDVSPTFLGDLAAYLGDNMALSIDQIQGYQAPTPYQATPISAEESTTSTTFVDLTTVGPILTTLPDGLYIVQWGASASVTVSTTRARMCLSVNGAVPDVTLQAYTSNGNRVGISFACQLTIQGGQGGNTIKNQYSVGASGATATFGSRWLLATKVGGA